MAIPTSVAELPIVFPARRLVSLWLTAVLLTVGASGLHILRSGSNVTWTVADWLINYRGGFVRRGLFGEIALRVSQATCLRPQTVVIAIAFLAYVALFGATLMLARHLRWNYWFLLLFLSPVTLQFPTISTSSYHKEILLFAGFAMLLLLLLRGIPDVVLSGYLTIFGAAGVLMHEPFIVYSPYFVAATYMFFRDALRVAKVLALPAMTCGVALMAVASHPGNRNTAQQVCASLGEANRFLCQGSIRYLANSMQDARADSIETAVRYGYMRFYPAITLFAVLPFLGCFLYLRRNSLPKDVQRALFVAIAVSATSSVLLFAYATDWGRWIHMHLMLIFLLLVAAGILYLPGPDQGQPDEIWTRKSVLATLGLLLYATCWSLPGYTDIPKWGYLSMAGRVIDRAAHKHVF